MLAKLKQVKPNSLRVKKLDLPIPDNPILTLKATFIGFMPDHLNTVSYFARYSAMQMGLPCSDVIHLPIDKKRYFINKGPHVHGNSKELFQEHRHMRTIQLYNSHPDSMQFWIKYVNEKLPSGVDFETEMFSWHSFSEKMEESADDQFSTFDQRVKEKSRKLLEQLMQPNVNKK